MLLLRLGSGHTLASQRVAGRPEFEIWTAVGTAEIAAASAAAVLIWPAFRALCRTTGRRAIIAAVGAWMAVGLLLTPGTRRIENSGEGSLWLLDVRLNAARVIVGLLLVPAFAGLVLAQTRLRTVRRDTPSEVADGKAGAVIVELLWLGTALHRFLISFAVVISGTVIAAGAYRAVLLADGLPSGKLPMIAILTYGAIYTAVCALIFVPSYVAWQDAVAYLRDRLFPVPANGMPSRDWSQGRSDFEAMLPAQSSAGRVFTAAFGILAPLAGSVLTALIPTP